MRLLIIEDELDVAETLRDFLLEEGHQVLLAANGSGPSPTQSLSF